MSKRAEEAGLKAYPRPLFGPQNITADDCNRQVFIRGYDQGEKETIERATEWIKTHWREYIIGPDADGCIRFGHWENDFRKAMEEE